MAGERDILFVENAALHSFVPIDGTERGLVFAQ